MAKYKTCEKCGAALDPGEICDCGKREAVQKDVAYEANQAAIREAVEAEVFITLEKKKGSETFRRKIEASSAPAALNGLAVLLREYAKLVGVNEIEVLALLATVMTVPAMGSGEEAKSHA
ncbi:hypothetical protein [uncultured Flavonifractor sp.]|uniref:hypothetical protein n=1 Tax=uncultured Flavonifractor sp. TaxID=1193534 RepID=UPI00261476FB|nr:hypothetical protein [uncultured Flavonifractor sp.]